MGMAVEITALAALAAFFVILAVLGAIFYGLIVSSKNAALGEVPVKSDIIRQEDEVRFYGSSEPGKKGHLILNFSQAEPVITAGRRNAASRMQATRRRRQEAAAASSSSNLPQQRDAHSDSGSESASEGEEVSAVCLCSMCLFAMQ